MSMAMSEKMPEKISVKMEAIVLAGGFGTRLRSVVKDVPKPMAAVAGKPLLEVLLGRLAEQGFTHVVLALGHLAEVIVEHFGREFRGMEITHVIEDMPLGTGGAVRLALTHCRADHAYVFNGDTFLAAIEPLWQQFHEPLIVARDVPDTSRYGRLETSGEHVQGFAEKGQSGPGLINAGCYVLPRHALDAFAPGTAFSLEQDFLCPLVPENPLRVFVSQGYFIDIGIPEDYERAQTELAQFIR
jgi:D-glycero-alpha-D-manno-heptose 1-phosphate guanylyltransferase